MDDLRLPFGILFAIYGAWAFWRAPQNVEWQVRTFDIAPIGLRWYVVVLRVIAAMMFAMGLRTIWSALG